MDETNTERAGGEAEARRPGMPAQLRALLRSALVDDEDPRFPWWLPLPGLALAAVWAAYVATTGDGPALAALLGSLLWPGAAIFVLTTLATFFGWQLDID